MTEPVSFPIAKLLKEKGFDKAFPTIAEAVMWLYNTYGIWIGVNLVSGLFWWEVTISDKYLCPFGLKSHSLNEAYEAAIEYVLKNVIPSNS